MAKNRLNIAVIPGDGIGKEVIPEGLRVLQAAMERFDINLNFDHFDFASYDYYAKHGQMMPDDWKAQIGNHDAIYFGAVGWPDGIPDHVSLWGSLILFRREFDQYVNLRPVKLLPGVPSPLANRGPGDVDMMIVRENTEGEYSSVGGRMFPDTDREFVTQQSVMTRIGVDRVLKFAFDLAQSRPRKHLTSATKSNGISITMPYWDERVEEVAKSYGDVSWDKYHIDILTANFVLHPIGLMLSWPLICLAISCRILVPPVPAPLALPHRAISTPSGYSRHCLNRFMARHLISLARALPILLAKSGLVP